MSRGRNDGEEVWEKHLNCTSWLLVGSWNTNGEDQESTINFTDLKDNNEVKEGEF